MKKTSTFLSWVWGPSTPHFNWDRRPSRHWPRDFIHRLQREAFPCDLTFLIVVLIHSSWPSYRAYALTRHQSRLSKVLSINRFTGIDTRAAIGTVDHPLVNQPNAPSIAELNQHFRQEGVRLSVSACKKAIAEWGGSVDEITHVVSTTCTNSANPGFDHYVTKELGLRSGVEKILLHGIGCSGGLAAIRAASNLALGSTFRKKPARILVLACEISSLLVRSELDSIDKEQKTRIGVCLFSDCASAAVLSNGVGEEEVYSPIYEILGWRHEILEDSDQDLGFDVDPLGMHLAK